VRIPKLSSMSAPIIHVEDGGAMFSADDSARDAIPEDSALRGMQLAMLQEVAPPALLSAVSEQFQRSWFEAVVLERAADHRCGWPACSALMQARKGRAQLLAKLVRQMNIVIFFAAYFRCCLKIMHRAVPT